MRGRDRYAMWTSAGAVISSEDLMQVVNGQRLCTVSSVHVKLWYRSGVLCYLFGRIAAHFINKIGELLPWNVKLPVQLASAARQAAWGPGSRWNLSIMTNTPQESFPNSAAC